MNIFEENFYEKMMERLVEQDDLKELAMETVDYLTKEENLSLIKEMGLCENEENIIFMLGFNQLTKYKTRENNRTEKFKTFENFFWIVNKIEEGSIPLFTFYIGEAENNRTQERGRYIYCFNVLEGLTSLKYESHFKDGSLAKRIMLRTADVDASMPETEYNFLQPKYGIHNIVNRIPYRNRITVNTRIEDTDFVEELWFYNFSSKERNIFLSAENGETGLWPMKGKYANFSEKDIPHFDFWDFSEEEYDNCYWKDLDEDEEEMEEDEGPLFFKTK